MAEGQMDIRGTYQAADEAGETIFRIHVYRSSGNVVAFVKEGQKDGMWFRTKYCMGAVEDGVGSRQLRFPLPAKRLTPKAAAEGLRLAAAELVSRGWIATMPNAAEIAAGVKA